MSWFGRTSHGSEPPGGDYVRYVERLNAAAGSGRPANDPAAGQAAETASRNRSAGKARELSFPTPAQLLGRASFWMISAGVGLVLLAILFSDFAYVDTFLPGMLLIAAGLAFRKHSRS